MDAQCICTYENSVNSGINNDRVVRNRSASANHSRATGTDKANSDIVVNPGTAYPLENSPIEHDLERSVIIEETNLSSQTKIFGETTDYSANMTAECFVEGNTCSALLDVWPDDKRSTVKVPEPNCSDEIPNFQQTSVSTCCEEITNSLPILEPNRCDENENSPHKQGQRCMNIYTNSPELPAPLGADEITTSPQRVQNVTGMHAPLGSPHQDITTWYQQIPSDCRHESIWPSSTPDESPTNVDFPAQHRVNTDNILSSHLSFKHNQDTHMHNPDQVAHTFNPSSISNRTAIILTSIFTRSFRSSWFCHA